MKLITTQLNSSGIFLNNIYQLMCKQLTVDHWDF